MCVCARREHRQKRTGEAVARRAAAYSRCMPTKAQEFRTEQARTAHPPKPKKPRKPRPTPVVDTSQLGVSASDRSSMRPRTPRKHAERRGGSVTEEPTVGKPSRKSTRKSTGRIKLATNLGREAVRKTQSPGATAARAQATKPVRGKGNSTGVSGKGSGGKARASGANNRGAGSR